MDSTYSPHSPDLSSFLSSSPTAQKFSQQPVSRQPYAPRSPTIPFIASNNTTSNHHHHLDINNVSYTPHSYPSNYTSNATGSFDSPGSLRARKPTQASYRTNVCVESQNLLEDHGKMSAKPRLRTENLDVWAPSTKANSIQNSISSYRGSRDKFQRKSSSATKLMPQYADPNPQKIEIKTKFPVARIKRIMQADEEVGKVAQVTPVAVSKALELFMIALVTGAADKAREKGSKKVGAQHLKLVVDGQPERFDFLADIVAKFVEGAENTSSESKANRKRKEESESASEEEKEKEKIKRKSRKKDLLSLGRARSSAQVDPQ